MDKPARAERAKVVVKELTQRIQPVLELHAASEIIVYADTLSSQIPPSRAALAFNSLQESIFQLLVIKLVSLWEAPADNRFSIPTAIALIDDGDLIAALAKETYEAHANRCVRNINPSGDMELDRIAEQSARTWQLGFARDQEANAKQSLRDLVKDVAALRAGSIAEALTNARDHMAHSLEKTRRELSAPVPSAKYGFEKTLLEEAMAAIETLYCWVNGTSFDIKGNCLEIAREQARDFWENLKFSHKAE
ncbi:MAG: hypothetical protein R3D56_13900 [Paracoccaceae bacterium]